MQTHLKPLTFKLPQNLDSATAKVNLVLYDIGDIGEILLAT